MSLEIISKRLARAVLIPVVFLSVSARSFGTSIILEGQSKNAPGTWVSGNLQNWQELDPQLRRLPHVVSVSPGLYGKVLLSGPVQSEGAELKGIPIDTPPEMLRHLEEDPDAIKVYVEVT